MTMANTVRGPSAAPRNGWRMGFIRAVGATLLLGFAPFALSQGQAPLPTLRLSAGLYVIQAEVARTSEQLQQGLMFRPELGPQQGMLFIFPQPQQQCMWMLNTSVPLAVAFLKDDGTIVNIEHMAPHTRTSHCSSQPVRLALEMSQGWFEQRGIKPGSRIRGLPKLP